MKNVRHPLGLERRCKIEYETIHSADRSIRYSSGAHHRHGSYRHRIHPGTYPRWRCNFDASPRDSGWYPRRAPGRLPNWLDLRPLHFAIPGRSSRGHPCSAFDWSRSILCLYADPQDILGARTGSGCRKRHKHYRDALPFCAAWLCPGRWRERHTHHSNRPWYTRSNCGSSGDHAHRAGSVKKHGERLTEKWDCRNWTKILMIKAGNGSARFHPRSSFAPPASSTRPKTLIQVKGILASPNSPK